MIRCGFMVLVLIAFSFTLKAEKLEVCCTITDLSDLVEVVGGNLVNVTTFAPASGNPHNVIAKPSFIRTLSKADLFLKVGFDLEAGWVPVLLKGARNSKILPDSKGYIDCSSVIKPIYDKVGKITRAHGHIHPLGNPHYLIDPVNGLKVAYLIAERLKQFRPDKSQLIDDNLLKFEKELVTKLIGNKLVEKYPLKKLSTVIMTDKLFKFLEITKQEILIGGWLKEFKNYENKKFIADHASYLYLAKRFEMEMVAYLEPMPGMTPTTSHLMKLIKGIDTTQPKAIFTNSYFPVKYAKTVASRTDLPILNLAHQVGSRKEASSYLKMVEYNIDEILKVLSQK